MLKWIKRFGLLLLLILGLIVLLCLYKTMTLTDVSEFQKHDTSLEFKQQLVETESQVAPPNPTISLVEVVPDLELRVAHWMPADSTVSGTVMLMHGFTEFIEKYYETIGDLTARGFHVVTFDWRGQGLSTRALPNHDQYYIEDFQELLADADAVYLAEVAELPRPHMILAHSMGAHVSSRILQDHPSRFDKAVLVAPMMKLSTLESSTVHSLASKMVSAGFGQSYIFGGADGDLDKTHEMVTSDEEKFKSIATLYKKERKLLIGAPTWMWFLSASESMMHAISEEQINKIKTPTLVVSPKSDQIVDPAAHETMAKYNPESIQILRMADAEHEVLMEVDDIRSQFWVAFDAFTK